MSLKSFVNNHSQWSSFLDMLNAEIAVQHKRMEQVADSVELHRAQGEIAALRKLMLLRDKLNHG
jgi:P2-related tail formation protein